MSCFVVFVSLFLYSFLSILNKEQKMYENEYDLYSTTLSDYSVKIRLPPYFFMKFKESNWRRDQQRDFRSEVEAFRECII